MELQRMLLSLCKERGLTLKKLAEKSGVPKATLHGWTTGRRAFDLRQLKEVAKTLGVSLHLLVFGEPDPFEDSAADAVLQEIFSGDVRVTLHRIKKKQTPRSP